MSDQVTCPKCNGKKLIVGNCECHSEWRSTDSENHYDDCRCEPDIECPQCGGKGVIDQD